MGVTRYFTYGDTEFALQVVTGGPELAIRFDDLLKADKAELHELLAWVTENAAELSAVISVDNDLGAVGTDAYGIEHMTRFADVDELEQFLASEFANEDDKPFILQILERKKAAAAAEAAKAARRNRSGNWISNADRQALYERDGHTCRYCGSTDSLSLDHIIPVSQGGTDEPDNLVTACRSCNSAKGGRTPKEAGMSLRMPRLAVAT